MIWLIYLLCSIALCLGVGQFAAHTCDCPRNTVLGDADPEGLRYLTFLCRVFYAQNCDLYNCYEDDAKNLCSEREFLHSWMLGHYEGETWVIAQMAKEERGPEVVEYMRGFCTKYELALCWLDFWARWAVLPALAAGAVLATVRICRRGKQ